MISQRIAANAGAFVAAGLFGSSVMAVRVAVQEQNDPSQPSDGGHSSQSETEEIILDANLNRRLRLSVV